MTKHSSAPTPLVPASQWQLDNALARDLPASRRFYPVDGMSRWLCSLSRILPDIATGHDPQRDERSEHLGLILRAACLFGWSVCRRRRPAFLRRCCLHGDRRPSATRNGAASGNADQGIRQRHLAGTHVDGRRASSCPACRAGASCWRAKSEAALKHIEFIQLEPTALTVLVSQNGDVETALTCRRARHRLCNCIEASNFSTRTHPRGRIAGRGAHSEISRIKEETRAAPDLLSQRWWKRGWRCGREPKGPAGAADVRGRANLLEKHHRAGGHGTAQEPVRRP